MTILYALLLGVLQGLTEFLPISSSGHLMLLENLLGIEGGSLFFNVLLHFATLIAVIIVFWKDVVEIVKHPFGEKMRTIIIATIPTVVFALIVKFCFDEFSLVVFLGFGFFISSLVIGMTAILQRKTLLNTRQITNKNAFVVGLVQGLAVLPGISRSGSTICAGLLQGVNREEAAKFSFLISLPVILGGLVFELIEGFSGGFSQVDWMACIVGFVSAFIIALFTIKLMMKIVKKGNWWYFSIYLFVLSIIVLLNQFVFCWF